MGQTKLTPEQKTCLMLDGVICLLEKEGKSTKEAIRLVKRSARMLTVNMHTAMMCHTEVEKRDV